MVFTQEKMDTLKISTDNYFTHIAELNSKISEFESIIKNSTGEFEFKYIIEKSEPSVEGICSYKELAWMFFQGPLKTPQKTGFHLVIRSFKAKESEYDDESKHSDKLVVKALIGKDLDKELSVGKFDDFLDAFKVSVEERISKLSY